MTLENRATNFQLPTPNNLISNTFCNPSDKLARIQTRHILSTSVNRFASSNPALSAHRAYEKCVLNSAKFKCAPESVLFLRDVLSMESQINCVTWDHRSKTDACNGGGSRHWFNLNANLLFPLLVVLRLL